MMEAESESEKKKKKKGGETPPPPDRSTPDSIDPAFTSWVASLFEGNERADKIVIQQRLGRNLQVNGEIVRNYIIPENEKPSQEKIVAIANTLLQEMQNEADTSHRTCSFWVIAHNPKKGGDFARRTMSVDPKRWNGNRVDGEDGDELAPFTANGGDMLLERFKSSTADGRWLFEQMTGTLGGMLQSLMDQNRELNQMVHDLFKTNMDLSRQANEAENNKLDRDLIREEKMMILEIKKKGVNFLAGAIPSTISSLTKGKVNVPGGKSMDSMAIAAVVENLSDAERSLLLGDWDEGKMSKQGILSEAQVRIIAAVAEQGASSDELDKLLIGEHAFTQEQIAAITSGQIDLQKLMPLLGIIKTRKDRLEAAAKGQ